MKKIFKKIKLDKKNILLIGLITALILFVDINFILKSRFKRIGVLKSKIEKLKSDIKKFNQDLSSLQGTGRVQAGAQGFDTIKKKMEGFMPEEKITQILEDISRVANERKVKIMRIVPLQSSGQPVMTTPSVKYFPLSIQLEISSGYHQLGKFLNDLENGGIFLAVETLQIRANDKYYPDQFVTLSLKTYVKK